MLNLEATCHGAPIYAAILCASDHLSPPAPEAMARAAMDELERTTGEVINGRLASQMAGRA